MTIETLNKIIGDVAQELDCTHNFMYNPAKDGISIIKMYSDVITHSIALSDKDIKAILCMSEDVAYTALREMCGYITKNDILNRRYILESLKQQIAEAE